MTEHLNRIIRERDVDAYCGLKPTQRAEADPGANFHDQSGYLIPDARVDISNPN